MKPAVQISNLTKQFIVPHEVRDTLKENVLNFLKRKTYERFNAVNGVSFEIQRGEFVGIIGKNGSGKSTLLKMMAGIYGANTGKVQTQGRIIPFLELGIGFQPELTARENIFINGTLLGMTRKQIIQKFDQIVSFAEVENFLDLKIKNYSSGMRARLAFAIAKEADGDIYLCDEVLAVGDESFQQKCINVFKEWHRQGKTIVLVSHNSELIKQLCTRVIMLENGNLVEDGPTLRTVDTYHRALDL